MRINILGNEYVFFEKKRPGTIEISMSEYDAALNKHPMQSTPSPFASLPTGGPEGLHALSGGGDFLNKAMGGTGLLSQNTRPQLDPLTDGLGGDTTRHRNTPIPVHLMYDVALYSDTLRTINNAIISEIFRNGIEVVTPDHDEKAEEEDSIAPSDVIAERERIKERMRCVNLNQQSLKEVCKMLEKDIEIIDDLFLVAVKDYEIDKRTGVIEDWATQELVRADPKYFEIIADGTGRPGYDTNGKPVLTCPLHRKQRYYGGEENSSCACGIRLYQAFYRGLQPDGEYVYYLEDEVYHESKYDPGLTYGSSPILSVWTKTITLINMDTYMMKYYGKQRPPRGILAVSTTNVKSVEKWWGWMLDQFRKNPHQVPPLILEKGPNDSGKGSPIEFIDFMRSLEEMQYTETREEMRRTIGAVYKVMPIFQGDMTESGGLNNEGLQITVTNRAIQDGQDLYNEGVFPWVCKQWKIEHHEIRLRPNEQEEERAKEEIFGVKAQNAQIMQQMGYEVTLTADNEFEYGPVDDPVKAPPDPMGGGGQGGFGDFLGGGGEGGEDILSEDETTSDKPPATSHLSGSPARPENLRKEGEGSVTSETSGVYNPRFSLEEKQDLLKIIKGEISLVGRENKKKGG